MGRAGGPAGDPIGVWRRAAAIAFLTIGPMGAIPLHAAAAKAPPAGQTTAGPSHAPAAASDASGPPAAATEETPSLEAEVTTEASLSPGVAQASADLERGLALLASKKGPQRLAPAEAAFTAAIDRLVPMSEALDREGRRVLARALDARAQTRLLRGRPKDADGDFGRIVGLEPAYEPDPAATPKRALDRYHKIRAPRVGFVTLKVEPPEASIFWNGRDLGTASGLSAGRPVLAGPYTVRARRDCYEEKEAAGEVAAGETKEIVLTLDAFARIVRFETSPAGFDVDIDGTFVGKTVAPEAPPPAGADQEKAVEEEGAPDAGATAVNGVLQLACVPAGDHAYTVRRDCYADVKGKLSVEIDLLDRSPILVPVIVPKKRETRLSVTTDTAGAVLYLDGKPVGPLPIRDRKLCAARASLEARVKDRVVWSQTRDLEDGPLEIAVHRRPTLALVTSVVAGIAPNAAAAERIHGRVAALRSVSVVDAPAARAGGGRDGGGKEASSGASPLPDLQLEVSAGPAEHAGQPITLRLVPLGLPQRAIDVVCVEEDGACIDRFFDQLDVAWSPTAQPPGTPTAPLPRVIAVTALDAAVLPPGAERNTSLMTLAGALIGAGAYREALDHALERPGWADSVPGPASAATAAFLSGICHQALGEAALSRAAYQRATSDPQATLWTPTGPPVAVLARLLLSQAK